MQIDEKGLHEIARRLANHRRIRMARRGVMSDGPCFNEDDIDDVRVVLSTLSLGTRIRLADGTEAVVVPVEPSWPMQIAGRDAMLAEDDELDLSTDDALAAYRAMVSALETK